MRPSRKSIRERLLGLGPWLLLVTIVIDIAALVLRVSPESGAQPFAVQPPIAPIGGPP